MFFYRTAKIAVVAMVVLMNRGGWAESDSMPAGTERSEPSQNPDILPSDQVPLPKPLEAVDHVYPGQANWAGMRMLTFVNSKNAKDLSSVIMSKAMLDGATFDVVEKQGTSLDLWVKQNWIEKAMERVDPDVVFVFLDADPENYQKAERFQRKAQGVVSAIGNRPCFWIGSKGLARGGETKNSFFEDSIAPCVYVTPQLPKRPPPNLSSGDRRVSKWAMLMWQRLNNQMVDQPVGVNETSLDASSDMDFTSEDPADASVIQAPETVIGVSASLSNPLPIVAIAETDSIYPPPPSWEQVRIMGIGDASLGQLSAVLRAKMQDAGAVFKEEKRYGASLDSWVKTGRIRRLLRKHKPSVVIVSLPLQTTENSPDSNAVKRIAEALSETACYWVGSDDHKHNSDEQEAVQQGIAPCVYLDPGTLTDGDASVLSQSDGGWADGMWRQLNLSR